MKPKWERKLCGCVRTKLSFDGHGWQEVMIRCVKHRGKPSKRVLAHFDDDGIVRRG